MSRSETRSGSHAVSSNGTAMMFLLLAFALTVFGIVMIYSASSIVCLMSDDLGNNPAHYASRQGIYALIGTGAAIALAWADYHVWMERLRYFVWGGTVLLLLAVIFAGSSAYGASRWIQIGGFGLQPSEFAKITVILMAAALLNEYYAEGSIDSRSLAVQAAICFVPIVLLIFKQPDKGTVLIMAITVAAMLFFAGFSPAASGLTVLGVIGFILLYASFEPYARARMEVARNPWIDPYGKGYQIIQGLYAFACGGFSGVGLGMSRQKYSYLPMAHNDFIFAVIGEELGFVGTVLVLAAFLFLLYLGYRIAQQASDLQGRLIASGCVTMMMIQLLINTSGVLGIIPLSGKPIPFLSYGGSSIIMNLMLVGLVLSVARHSDVTQTSREERRSSFRVYDGRGASGFRVLSGGVSTTPESLRKSRDFASAYGDGRISTNTNGTRRIDLGPSPSDRLRGRGASRGGRE